MKVTPPSLTASAWTLLGVAALCLSLPLFTTLGAGPTFFVAHEAAPSHILLLVLSVFLLIPALVWVIALLSGRWFGSAVFVGVLSAAVAAGVALWVMSLVQDWPARYAVPIAVALGAAAGWAYRSDRVIRPLLLMVGQVSVAIPLFFLFFTPVRTLLHSPDGAVVEAGGGAERTPVVMLVLDELPTAALMREPGKIDAQRFPGFARLAGMSTWYRNTTTASTNTHLAISAILSGQRPDEATLPIPGQLPQNLFSALAGSHRVLAVESVSRLCTPVLCESSRGDVSSRPFSAAALFSDVVIVWLHSILPRTLAERYLPPIAGQWRDFRDAAQTRGSEPGVTINAAMTDGFDAKHDAQWQLFLQRLSQPGPVLNYLHLGLPHHPWIYLPDGTVYNGRETPATTYTHDWRPQPALVRQAALRFALQAEYVDRLVGELLDTLEGSGQLDETLLIVVADHGLAIAPGAKRRAPLTETFADVAVVPLFIKYPGQAEPVVDDRVVETIDILPTVLEVLDISPDGSLDGQALNSGTWVQPRREVLGVSGDVSQALLEPDVAASVERFLEPLLPDETAVASWSVASGGEYLGQSVEGIQLTVPELEFVLDRPRWYSSVDVGSGFLPLRLTGRVEGAAPGTPIYIALNGVIAGGSVTHDRRGAVSVMLQPSAFRAGDNVVEAFALRDGALARLPSQQAQAPAWQVAGAGQTLSVIGPDGQRYRLDAEKQGEAVLSRSAPLAAIVGTAFDESRYVTPDTLLLVDGNRILTDQFRAYPGRTATDPMSRTLVSTFTVEIEARSLRDAHSLQVLAIWDDGTFLPIPVTDNAVMFQ